MWPTVVTILGVVATLVTILVPLLTFGYSSLKTHITQQIERELSDTTVERRVADKLTDRMLEASRVITDTETTLTAIQSNITELTSEEARARSLSTSIRNKLEQATRRNRDIEQLQNKAESTTLALTTKVGSADPDVIAKSRALVDLVQQNLSPSDLLLEIQSQLTDLKQNAARTDWPQWSNDFKLCSIRSASEGGLHREQPPEIIVDSFGAVHLRGNIMRAMGYESIKTEKEILEHNRPIEISFDEYDYSSLFNVVLFLPGEYRPSATAKFIVSGYPNGPKTIEIDPNSFAEDSEGTRYFAVLASDWFEICIDGVSWTPEDPKAAIARFQKHLADTR